MCVDGDVISSASKALGLYVLYCVYDRCDRRGCLLYLGSSNSGSGVSCVWIVGLVCMQVGCRCRIDRKADFEQRWSLWCRVDECDAGMGLGSFVLHGIFGEDDRRGIPSWCMWEFEPGPVVEVGGFRGENGGVRGMIVQEVM